MLAAIGSAPADAPLTAVADTALVFVEAMSAYSMWPVLDAALQYSPIQALLDARVHSTGLGGRRSRAGFVAQLSKAENFERRRQYYERVRSVAGLGADGT